MPEPGPWRGIAAALALFALGASPALGLTLDLPAAATLSGSDSRAADSLLVPTGPRSRAGGSAELAEGRITRRAWVVPRAGLTPFQLMAPLREQLVAEGFTPLYECSDRACGGFDFRLALDLLDAPAMHVDLGDFRYLAASREGSGGTETLLLVASRSAGTGHLHITLVTPPDAPEGLSTVTVRTGDASGPAPATDFAARLEAEGHAVLDGLVFRPGSSELGDGPFPVLGDLAGWLLADPARRVVLVGHSDNVGGLDDNIRLSERRADAVVRALVREFGVPAERLSARGVGYLAPMAPNDTEEGRRLNRRVEAVIGAP